MKKDGKINFVDDNNVLVGFDSYQSCCENFGWFISEIATINKPEGDSIVPTDLDNFIFNTGYFAEFKVNEYSDVENCVIFKLKTKEDSWKNKNYYLHLFNSHNGYYSHGFAFENGNEIIKSGSL